MRTGATNSSPNILSTRVPPLQGLSVQSVISDRVSENHGGGVYGLSTMASCVAWTNGCWCLNSESDIRYSCVEFEDVGPGEGSINEDPRSCGWPDADIFVHDPPGLEAAAGDAVYPDRALGRRGHSSVSCRWLLTGRERSAIERIGRRARPEIPNCHSVRSTVSLGFWPTEH